MRRVLALTGGRNVPSARFRVGQFAGRLEGWGVRLEERPSRVGMYPPREAWKRPAWLAATLADRLPDVLSTHRHDVTLLQRELVSTLSTLETLTRTPRVLDVDDAIWLLPRGSFAARLARRADRVICGNAFLAEYFARVNRDVVILPTAVDTSRFTPAELAAEGSGGDEPVTIGWSGSSAGFPYLASIDAALADVVRARPQVRIRLLADRSREFKGVPWGHVEFIAWAPEREVHAIQGMDIGVMPLGDTDWERGKCSYKMLLYLACGVPAVVSPVGMNAEVLAGGDVGVAARTHEEWVAALVGLVDDAARRRRLGAAGRQLVLNRYSWDVVAPGLARALS